MSFQWRKTSSHSLLGPIAFLATDTNLSKNFQSLWKTRNNRITLSHHWLTGCFTSRWLKRDVIWSFPRYKIFSMPSFTKVISRIWQRSRKIEMGTSEGGLKRWRKLLHELHWRRYSIVPRMFPFYFCSDEKELPSSFTYSFHLCGK